MISQMQLKLYDYTSKDYKICKVVWDIDKQKYPCTYAANKLPPSFIWYQFLDDHINKVNQQWICLYL